MQVSRSSKLTWAAAAVVAVCTATGDARAESVTVAFSGTVYGASREGDPGFAAMSGQTLTGTFTLDLSAPDTADTMDWYGQYPAALTSMQVSVGGYTFTDDGPGNNSVDVMNHSRDLFAVSSLGFNVDDPSLATAYSEMYLSLSDSTATKLSSTLLEVPTLTGWDDTQINLVGYTALGGDVSYIISADITSFGVVTAVPLPAAAWGGFALLGGIGLHRLRRRVD